MSWSSHTIEDLMENITNGGPMPRQNPFYDGDTDWRGKNIAFEYAQEEIEEKRKTAAEKVKSLQ